MGLFSTVINHCPALGPELIGELQSKSLQSLMDLYWLAPDGTLFRVDEEETYDLVPSGDSSILLPFRRVPTGKRGRVTPYRQSGLVRFVGRFQGEYLEAVAHFKTGQLTAVVCKGPVFSCNMVDS